MTYSIGNRFHQTAIMYRFYIINAVSGNVKRTFSKPTFPGPGAVSKNHPMPLSKQLTIYTFSLLFRLRLAPVLCTKAKINIITES